MGPGLTNTYSFSPRLFRRGLWWYEVNPGMALDSTHDPATSSLKFFSVLARTRLSAPVLITTIAFARPCNDCWFNSLYSALNCKLGESKDYVLFINGANHIRGFALCINTNFLTE